MKKRTLALILAALLALTAFVAVPVTAETSGDWQYTVNEDGATATITKYTGSATNVTIPSVIGGYSVTAIGNYAFYNCTSLTSVTIPDGVATIEKCAFYNCTSLTSVTIPDSVTTIGEYAFSDCTSLTNVTIPNSVTTIGHEAFYNCTSLTSVTLGDGVTTIGEWAFSNCTSLTTVYYGGSQEQWEAIMIEDDNDPLLNAEIVFNFTEPAVKPGDLTGDGKINSRDVIALMKLVLTPGAEVTAANDLNSDGKLNSRDVIALMKLVLAQV